MKHGLEIQFTLIEVKQLKHNRQPLTFDSKTRTYNAVRWVTPQYTSLLWYTV